MRILLLSALILGFISQFSCADTLEFPAGSATSLEIPAGTSIQIGSASSKGNAAGSIKIKIKIGEVFHDLSGVQLGGVYINGPATLSSQTLVSARSTGIRYQLALGGNTVRYDYDGSGNYGMFIPFDQGNYQYRTYLDWLNAGNTPLPADAYTGTDAEIAASGILIQFTRFSNQPFRTLILTADQPPQTISIASGRKLVVMPSVIAISGLTSSFRNGYSLPMTTDSYGFTIEGPEILELRKTSNPWFGQGQTSAIFSYYFSDETSPPVADSMVNAIASKITSTSGTYGIATKSELASSLAESRTAGINSVLSNPNLWTLYTTSQIQNMAVGDLVLTRQVGGGFVLNYDIEQSTDLQTWTTYAPLSLPLTGLPTDKAFVRIKAKQ